MERDRDHLGCRLEIVESSAASLEINAAPLPISLSGFGWTNCIGFNDAVTLPTVNTDATGLGIYPLAIPNQASLDGVIVYGQWFTLDTSEPGSLTFSNQTRVLVGLTP